MAKNKVEINGIKTNELKSISHEEMVKLFERLNNGEKNIKSDLVKYNLKLVLSILKKYHNKCDNMDDLFQIGVIGLIKAIDNFDISFGVKFSTYAVFMIEGEIKRYIRDNSQIRISRGIKELSYEIINFRETYFINYSEYPSNEIVCEEFNISSINEIQKEKLRGILLFFRGDKNNLKVEVKVSQDKEPIPSGAIYATKEILAEIGEIVGKENIKLRS